MDLYFYPNTFVNIAKTLKPSDRGKLEITTLIQNNLKVELMGRGFLSLIEYLINRVKHLE